MTTQLVLHQYAESPFSEKIRAVLGYKQLHWHAVTVPVVMPKPDVVALTGGYRRTPILQVGADIYCDTALICDVLEHVQPAPPLYPPHLRGCTRVFAQWADGTLFWAAIAVAFQARGVAQLFGGDAAAIESFRLDRKAMQTNLTYLRAADATSALRSYLRRIASMVEEHEFLFGAEPCVADFAAYHPLWFLRRQTPAMAGVLSATPAVLEWMDRIAELGHATHDEMTAQDALTVAGHADPMPPGSNLLVDSAFQDDHGIPLGSRVTITPESFGTEPTQGELIAATRTHYSLQRTDERAGTVHVHFPRIGYVLRPAPAA